MPRRPATSSTRRRTSLAGTRLMVSGSAMFSRAVRVSSRLESWKMKPSCSRRKRASFWLFIRVTSAPLMTTCPEVTASMVDTQLSSVDLPDPEAPMMPRKSPLFTVNETSLSARVTFERVP